MKFQRGDKVIDRYRAHIYGETVGEVLGHVGVYRVEVKWPDERGTQMEKALDLEKA